MPEERHPEFAGIARTQAALRLSEATKTAILNTALDCIITIDHEGLVVDWNPAAERTFGYSRGEALGREMAVLIIPEAWRARHRHGLARAVQTGHDVMAGRRIEITARRKSGEEFPVELGITRITAGPQPMFTGHIRDISERKQAERALREQQQLLDSITRNIGEAIFRRSMEQGLIFVNEAYVRMFGYGSPDELRGVPPEKLYADPARRREVVRVLQRDGILRNEEVAYRRKDGSCFWGLTSATGIREEATGKILFYDGAINDITERKQAALRLATQYAVARTLAESEQLAEAAPRILQAVCENLAWDLGAIWNVDARGARLRCVNVWPGREARAQPFEQATRAGVFAPGVGLPGRIWQSAEPEWIADLLADANFPRIAIAAQCGLRSGFGFPVRLEGKVLGVMEFFSRDHRKPDAPLLEMFAAIGSQVGQFIQRKRAEASLLRLNRNLERRITARTQELAVLNDELELAHRETIKALEQEKELNRLKTNFVGVVSHEFRTPLGVIVSSAEILENYFDRLTPGQRAGHLQDIRHSTRQMTHLMEEVLLLGSVESSRMQCKPQPLDLCEICRRLVEEQQSASNRKCPIFLEIQGNHKPACGDEGLLRHIFNNLLSNAVKYSPAGRPVHFSVKRDGANAVFAVRDRGIGIPAEDQRRLFEAFQRARNVGEIPGTGLGLVIVKRCVGLHGGAVELESEPGRGTTFLIRLPLFAAHRRRRTPAAPPGNHR